MRESASVQGDLQFEAEKPLTQKTSPDRSASISDQLAAFKDFGTTTRVISTEFEGGSVPTFVNEFWTARQRQANSLHEVSYRACFKPQLPRFFIERLTNPGDVVYDPFMGRGTTPVEAALLGRIPFGNDINPLSLTLTTPRLCPPTVEQIENRLAEIPLTGTDEFPEELLAIYHPETLREICALKRHFIASKESSLNDSERSVDDWLRMVALNRLTGHSPGFFSVYTLPPNQAVSVASQLKINAKRNQTPPRRDIKAILLKKSRQLLGDVSADVRETLSKVAKRARFVNCPADDTKKIAGDSVSLVVTSPPFLDVVQYADDNWLRCWFLGLDAKSLAITTPKKLDAWAEVMTRVLRELHRVLKPGGHVAFEVGEVNKGKTRLEETVLPCGVTAGFKPVLVLINDQEFTKTANCWGVKNMGKGTNTNRVVLLQKKF